MSFRRSGRAFVFMCIALVSMAFARGARAASEADAFGGKNNGAYTTSVPITVPSFHGIEPKLSLQYSSGGGNGFVGVGWSIGGLSRIEPFGPGHAVDDTSMSPTFFLDGQELVPCATGSTSPSCTTGTTWTGSSNGFFSTKTESFVRIQHVPGTSGAGYMDDLWYVWQKNGARLTYKRIGAGWINQQWVPWRWVISQVQDANGNTVNYNWLIYYTSGNLGNRQLARIDSITYNGTSVNFYWDTRPDQEEISLGENAGCGLGDVIANVSGTITRYGYPYCGIQDDLRGETLLQRVKTIDVTVGGARARAYQLNYTTAGGSTGRSLLSSVQMFGTDAQLDGTGTITNATTASSLPPVSMGWPNVPRGSNFFASNELPLLAFSPTGSSNSPLRPLIIPAEFNGNGKADFLVVRQGDGGSVPVRYFRCLDTIDYVDYGTPLGCNGWDSPSGLPSPSLPGSKTVAGDFNGDGLTDFLIFSEASGTFQKWYSDPNNPSGDFIKFTGTFTGPATSSPSDQHTDLENRTRVIAADFNGDSYTDILYYNTVTGYFEKWYSHDSTMNGGFDRQPGGNWGGGNAITALDLDGDHQTDFAVFNPGNLNSGVSPSLKIMRSASSAQTADFVSYDFASFYFNQPSFRNPYYVTGQFVAADFNGDGRGDLLFYNSMGVFQKWYFMGFSIGFDITNTISISDGNCNGPSPNSTISSQGSPCAFDYYGNGPTVLPMDFNGDGKTDLLLYQSYTGYMAKWYGSGMFAADFDRQSKTTVIPYASPIPVDFNGDTRQDLILWRTPVDDNRHPTNPNQWYATVYFSDVGNGVQVPDLLSSISNGTGGTTTVNYAASNSFIQNPSVNSQIVLQAVTSITDSDGRGGSYQSTIKYEQPFFDQNKHLFQGFRKVTFTKPNGAYTEVYYHQRYASAGKVRATYNKDALGNIYSYECIHYNDAATACDSNQTNIVDTTQNAPAGTVSASLVDQYWSYTCDGAGTCKRWADFFTYDPYANVTYQLRLGDYDGSNDETLHVANIAVNPSAYIVNKPYYSYVAESNNLSYAFNVLAASRVYYDTNATLGAPPTAGNMTQECSWLSTTGGYVCSSMLYDSYGNVTSTTDGRGNVASQTWDSTYHTLKTSVTNVLGQSTTVDSFDARCGAVTHETNVNGNGVTTTYDTLCRKVRVDYPDGSWETKSFLNYGNPNTQHVRTARSDGSTDGLWSDTYFDGVGRTYETMNKANAADPSPITVMYQYDTFGRLWKKSNPYFSGQTPVYTVTEYDGMNRVNKTTNPVGGITTMSYGVQSGVNCTLAVGIEKNCYFDWTETVDPAGRKTRTIHDAYSNPVAVGQWDTAGGAYVYTYTGYDLIGRVVRIQDADGNLTTYAYDSLGRRVSASDPNMGILKYAYDANGNMTYQTDAQGRTIKLDYDAANRVTLKSYCTTAACTANTGTVASYYDELPGTAWPTGYGASKGRLTRQVDSRSSIAKRLAYDNMGRVTDSESTINGTAYDFHTTFDGAGRANQLVYPDGEVVTTTYDAAGRPYSVGGTSQYVTQALYNASSEIRQIQLGFGTLNLAYNDLGLLASSSDSSGTLQNMAFTYLPNGQIQSARDNLHGYESFDYVYDSFGRLSTATHVSNAVWNVAVSYSPSGRILSKSSLGTNRNYTYPTQGAGSVRPHAPTQVGDSNDFSYDASGNMLTGAGRTYVYDENNRPTSIVGAAGTETMTYDGDGQRAVKVEANGSTTISVSPVYEITDGVPTKYYLFGGAVVARRVSTSAPEWIVPDRQGGIQKLVAQNGVVTRHQMFLPFGEAVYFSTTSSEAHEYTGHEKDGSGLLYMNARYYDPVVGQFTTPDSLRQNGPQQLDPYAYVMNDPTNLTDPTGHFAIEPILVMFVEAFVDYVAGELASGIATQILGTDLGPVVGTVLATLAGSGGISPLGMIKTGFAVAGLEARRFGWNTLTVVLDVAETATLGAMDGQWGSHLTSLAESEAAHYAGVKDPILNIVGQTVAGAIGQGVDDMLAGPPPAPPEDDDSPAPPSAFPAPGNDAAGGLRDSAQPAQPGENTPGVVRGTGGHSPTEEEGIKEAPSGASGVVVAGATKVGTKILNKSLQKTGGAMGAARRWGNKEAAKELANKIGTRRVLKKVLEHAHEGSAYLDMADVTIGVGRLGLDLVNKSNIETVNEHALDTGISSGFLLAAALIMCL